VESTDLDVPITLEHHTFVDYAFNHWLDSLKAGVPSKTLCLLGPPGIGKSSTAYDIRKRMEDYVRANPQIIFGVETVKEALKLLTELREEELGKAESKKLPALTVEDIRGIAELLDFSSKLPEDLGGLPFRAPDNFVDYCPQRWVGRLSRKFAFGVYVEDDLAAAAQAMQTAGRQSALERRIHEHKFAPGILVMVTGNRREDRSAAATLPAHFRNSVCLISIEPSVDEWKKWYGKQRGCDPIIAAYLTWRPEDLSQLPKDNDKMGAFATPRQWHSLGQQFKTAMRCGDAVLLAIAAGLIGKPRALDFVSFVEIKNTLVDPEKVFEDPQGALPKPVEMLDEPSKCIAMVCALGEIAAHRWKRKKGKVKDEAPEKLLRSLAWVCAAGDEYSAVGVQTFLDSGGNLTAIARVARDQRGDPIIGRLLDHVKSALLGGA